MYQLVLQMESESSSEFTISSKTTLTKAQLIDRIQGCIFGAALGDAVGLATEFMTKVNARHLYGVGPIKFGKAEGFEFWRDGHRSRWYEGDYTDDTDQLLLILQCILSNNGTLDPRQFAFRLREWIKVGFPEIGKPPCGIGFTVGSTISHEQFLSDPFLASYSIWDRNKRNLAPNGAVMRTAVIGVPNFWDEQTVAENAIRAAKVTHADPRSIVSAVIVSVIVSRVLTGAMEGERNNVLTEAQKRYLTELMLQGTELAESTYAEEVKMTPKPTNVEPVVGKPGKSGILTKLQKLFKPDVPTKLHNEQPQQGPPELKFPEHPPLDRKRGETPAKIPSQIPKSLDSYAMDTRLIQGYRQVVEEYKFLLDSSPFYNPTDTRNWVEDLEFHCFPKALSDLELDDKKCAGYTYKCLGAGVHAASKCKDEGQSDAHFFKEVITQLTLEAGDADTNCAVAGALLGIRLGKQGLPSDWLEELRHGAFIEKLVTELCSLALTK